MNTSISSLRHFVCRLIFGFAFYILFLSHAAALDIEIVGGGATQIPITIVPFAGEERLPQSISTIVSADLQRSGLFKLVETGGLPRPSIENPNVNYGDWKARGADALVFGSVTPLPDGRIEVKFRLLDTVKQTPLAGLGYTITVPQARLTAHNIADVIYEKLTGDVGVFSTKIAYVVKQGRRYELQVSDADGFNAQTILRSNESIISPAWSPDGTQIAYVSFEKKKPIIYVQGLYNQKVSVLANYKGSNSAPAWAPDGKRLAIVLTKDGTSQIYMVNSDGSGLRRLTYTNSIDTEPSFSPDGQHIIFTSDRGGSPQIYRMPANGGQAERLTFEGSYNVSPRYSPDGKNFAFVQRNNGRFNIAISDFNSQQIQILTENALDESPSFAPNGKLILYASEVRGRGALSAVSSDGRVKQRLTATSGDIREPAWGPLSKINAH